MSAPRDHARRKAGTDSSGSPRDRHDEPSASREAVHDSSPDLATSRDPATRRESESERQGQGQRQRQTKSERQGHTESETEARRPGALAEPRRLEALAEPRRLGPASGPSLLTIVRRALEGECRLAPGSIVLVAVSGGPDSMALLSCLARLAPRFALSVRAHGVDHGLRPEAAAELDLAQRFAAEHHIPFGRTKVDVTRGGNLQARAREARWAALREAAKEATKDALTAGNVVIATAHHAEDRAETVLMRILRGAGARGLAVLPPRGHAASSQDASSQIHWDVVRPLLRAQRSDVMAHLSRHRVPFATDPSNSDPRYLRTRVRNEVMPLLRALDPAIVSHLAAIADDLGAALAPQPKPTPTPSRASWTAGLPRATQQAIAELLRTRSKGARVWLPDGLVVMAETRRARKETPNSEG